MNGSREWKGDTGGGALGQQALILFFRRFGLKAGYTVMALVVPFYMIFAHRRYLAIYHYFRRQFGLSKWKSFLKTYKNHFLFGQIILDRFAVFAGRRDLFEVEIIGKEYFNRLADGEKGFMIVGSHVGNFEIGGYMLNSTKKHINALVYPNETETVKKYRTKIMELNNITVVPAPSDKSDKSDLSHIFALNAALQRGEIVSMPADRDYGSKKTVECDFLNGKASFPIGPFAMATSAEVEVLAIFCLKTGTKQYKIFVIPIGKNVCNDVAHISRATKRTKIESLARSYVAELEAIVKQYPAQWFNYYEFWKGEK